MTNPLASGALYIILDLRSPGIEIDHSHSAILRLVRPELALDFIGNGQMDYDLVTRVIGRFIWRLTRLVTRHPRIISIFTRFRLRLFIKILTF